MQIESAKPSQEQRGLNITRRGFLKVLFSFFAGITTAKLADSAFSILGAVKKPLTRQDEMLDLTGFGNDEDLFNSVELANFHLPTVDQIVKDFSTISSSELTDKFQLLKSLLQQMEKITRSLISVSKKGYPDTLIRRAISELKLYSKLAENSQKWETLSRDEQTGQKFQNAIKFDAFMLLQSLRNQIPNSTLLSNDELNKFDFFGTVIFDEGGEEVELYSRAEIAKLHLQEVAQLEHKIDGTQLINRFRFFDSQNRLYQKWAGEMLFVYFTDDKALTLFGRLQGLSADEIILNCKNSTTREFEKDTITYKYVDSAEAHQKLHELRVSDIFEKIKAHWSLFLELEKKYQIPAYLVAALIANELSDVKNSLDNPYAKELTSEFRSFFESVPNLKPLLSILRNFDPAFDLEVKTADAFITDENILSENHDWMVKQYIFKKLGVITSSNQPTWDETTAENIAATLGKNTSIGISQLTIEQAKRERLVSLWGSYSAENIPNWLVVLALSDEKVAIESAFNYVRNLFNGLISLEENGKLLHIPLVRDLFGSHFSQHNLTASYSSHKRGSFPIIETYTPYIISPISLAIHQYSGAVLGSAFPSLSDQTKEYAKRFPQSAGYRYDDLHYSWIENGVLWIRYLLLNETRLNESSNTESKILEQLKSSGPFSQFCFPSFRLT